ncbi:hypothetical protein NQZ68_000843 [Dissostichus eleginoides]|nr:hypothetical protein NQZ68_000843 [Dissostichus eleginoides]
MEGYRLSMLRDGALSGSRVWTDVPPALLVTGGLIESGFEERSIVLPVVTSSCVITRAMAKTMLFRNQMVKPAPLQPIQAVASEIMDMSNSNDCYQCSRSVVVVVVVAAAAAAALVVVVAAAAHVDVSAAAAGVEDEARTFSVIGVETKDTWPGTVTKLRMCATTATNQATWPVTVGMPTTGSATPAVGLVTSRDFVIRVGVGIAYLGGVCSTKRKCVLAEDNGLNLAFTIAHELGHKLTWTLCQVYEAAPSGLFTVYTALANTVWLLPMNMHIKRFMPKSHIHYTILLMREQHTAADDDQLLG